MIPPSCGDPARQAIPSSSKEKGIFQKQWSSDLATGHCCLSPHEDLHILAHVATAAVLPRPGVLRMPPTGLSQLGGWRKPGPSKHHAGCPTKLWTWSKTAGTPLLTSTAGHMARLASLMLCNPRLGRRGRQWKALARGGWFPTESQPMETVSPKHRPCCRLPRGC